MRRQREPRRVRRRRRRGRPERPGGGDRAGEGWPLGAGPRGEKHPGRRRALRGADAARLRPRCLLGDPPAGARLAAVQAVAAGGSRPRVGPPADPAGPPVRRRLGDPAAALHQRDGGRPGPRRRRLAATDGPVRLALASGCAPDLLAPLRPPRHPLLLARFGMLAVLPNAVLARLAFREARARALFTGIVGARDAAARPTLRAPRSGWCWGSPATPSAGRCREAGRSGSRTRWSPTCARSAARSRPMPRSSRWTTCRPTARSCST